ncbi:hypothetical protein NPIL_38071 [Nephila pilipes]|uniref:Uncharacterized protein n=1 Tax=Nephila pilipes TaxID=299642 RepID=A0A8X6PJQ9_NEPPI|nr:hypothetical protein NPIL_38071 [Nephila pilipes]
MFVKGSGTSTAALWTGVRPEMPQEARDTSKVMMAWSILDSPKGTSPQCTREMLKFVAWLQKYEQKSNLL